MIRYLLDAFAGPAALFMYALLAVLAFALAVMVERALFFLQNRPNAGEVLAACKRQLSEGTKAALGTSPLEQVLSANLSMSNADLGADAMQAAAVEAEESVRQRISYLAAVASIATMLGLTGTVYGLILAFGALGNVAAAERAARLSEGSSTAMATTAFGLFVAIPALGAHAIFEAQARSMLAAIEAAAGRLHVFRKAESR